MIFDSQTKVVDKAIIETNKAAEKKLAAKIVEAPLTVVPWSIVSTMRWT